MLYKEICKVFSYFFYAFAIILLFPLGLAIFYEFFADPTSHPQPHSSMAFVYTILVSIILGQGLGLIGGKGKPILYRKEGLIIVTLIWFITPVIGALPYMFSHTLDRFDQAYFEAVSGFTTTGLSIIEPKHYDPATGKEVLIRKMYCGSVNTTYEFYGNITPVRDTQTGQILYEGVEAISKAVLFWRSFTQWLGGVGIIVLFVALMPVLGVGGKMLYQTEMPGPIKEGLTPRITETAGMLWKIYLALSILLFFALMVTNPKMEWFDALTLTFSTISTGGFSIRNDNIAYYNNIFTEVVILIFMIAGSINFSLYYYTLKGKIYRLLQPELFLFIISIIVGGAAIAWNLVGTTDIDFLGRPSGIYSLSEAIFYGFFHLVSAQTTTGYYTVDYDHWPYIVQVLMLVSMYLGGMAGSTAGGMKIMRLYMLFHIAKDKIDSLFTPSSVSAFRIGESKINAGAAINVLCFFLTLIAISTVGVVVFVWDGIDPETALGLTACNINNVGIAFRAIGPSDSAGFLSIFSSYFSCFLMLLGRLEFFAVLVLLVPAFWRENS